MPEPIAPVVRTGRFNRHLVPALVLVIGLVVTGVLAAVCWTVNNRNETRLLHLQVSEVGTVLSAAIPDIVSPLSSAAEIAAVTDGNPAKFSGYIAPYTGAKGPFISVALWRLNAGQPQLVAKAGADPNLGTAPSLLDAQLTKASGSHSLQVTGFFGARNPHITYALSAVSAPQLVVMAETAIHPRQPLKVARNSAFGDLNYALYLGRTPNSRALLGGTSIGRLPLTGRTDSVSTPLGNATLLLVATPAGELGGTLVNRLPWIVAVLGTLFTVIACLATELLVRERRLAEQLAMENHVLYGEQRGIAQTLQHALLSEDLPTDPDFEFGVRYLPGAEGVEVGGDWYDVISVDDESTYFFVVGDVSGRGIAAATTMASLRYAIRAYAVQGDQPATVLTKLGSLLDVGRDSQFATVLCGLVSVAHDVTLASAGHPPPLLITGHGCDFVATAPGVPIGVPSPIPYSQVTITVPPKATLLAFTDGLIERRGESLDIGLKRLREAAERSKGSIDQQLTEILRDTLLVDSQDDTALLGMRWTT